MTTLAGAARPAFAHASEAELARILDFYRVPWIYEPDTFPIGWSLSGDVVESFSPDFYLPEMDLYLELTTLKQKLVRKKNRKLRRLRELYPDIRIKLFYARDFRMLLLKFGRLALADELSGTIGQATPPRPADQIVLEAAEHAAVVPPAWLDAVAASAPPASPSAIDTAHAPGASTEVGAEDVDDADESLDGLPVGTVTVSPSRSSIRNRGRRARRRRREAEAAALAALVHHHEPPRPEATA